MLHRPLVLIDGVHHLLPAGDTLANTGDMYIADYDLTEIKADVFDRSNHFGTYNITDFIDHGPVALLNVGPMEIDENPPAGMVAPGAHIHTCHLGDMYSMLYDPTGVQDDIFNRSNHHGTQLFETVEEVVPNSAGYLDLGPADVDLEPQTIGLVAPWNHFHSGYMEASVYDPDGLGLNPLDRANHIGTQDMEVVEGWGAVAFADIGEGPDDAAAGDHSHAVFEPCDDNSDGESGFVPAPSGTDEQSLLTGAGLWKPLEDVLTQAGLDLTELPQMKGATDGEAGKEGVPRDPLAENRFHVITGKNKWKSLNEVLADNDSPFPVGSIPEFTPFTGIGTGKAGLMIKPVADTENKALKGDGTWAFVSDIITDSGASVPLSALPLVAPNAKGLIPTPTEAVAVFTGGGWKTIQDILGTEPFQVNPENLAEFDQVPPTKGVCPAPPDKPKAFLHADKGWRDINQALVNANFQVDITDLAVFTGPDDGVKGLVPPQTPADNGKFLTGDGTFKDAPPTFNYRGTYLSQPYGIHDMVHTGTGDSYVYTSDSSADPTGSQQLLSKYGGIGIPGPDGLGSSFGEITTLQLDEFSRALNTSRFMDQVAEKRNLYGGIHQLNRWGSVSYTYNGDASPFTLTAAYFIVQGFGSTANFNPKFSRDNGASWELSANITNKIYGDPSGFNVFVSEVRFKDSNEGKNFTVQLEGSGSYEGQYLAWGHGCFGRAVDTIVENTPGAGITLQSIITANGIPESNAGLPSGALWSDPSDSDIIKVVP